MNLDIHYCIPYIFIRFHTMFLFHTTPGEYEDSKREKKRQREKENETETERRRREREREREGGKSSS